MASGVFFFSSPPRHPSTTTFSGPWQRQSSAIFSTPQYPSKQLNNWDRPFFTASSASATSPGLPPSSPPLSSPLQPSRNVNLMSSSPRNSDNNATTAANNYNKHTNNPPQHTDENDENTTFPTAATNSTDPITSFSSSTKTNTKPFFFLDANTTTTTSSSSFPISPSTITQQHPQLQFQFSSRAKQTTSPSALLQSHTKSTRDSRRRLFLDRVRNRRDDARTDRAGDQVLRMDYVRERREWEAEKERLAGTVGGWDDDMIDEDYKVVGGGGGEEEEGMLCPTEEEEIRELAGFCFLQQRGKEERDGAFGEFSDDDDDESAYDEVFREFMRGENVSENRWDNNNNEQQRENGQEGDGEGNKDWAGGIDRSDHVRSSRLGTDAEMDLS